MVIAVTAILSVTVFSLVVSLNRFYYTNEKNADIKDELTRTESFIKDWFNLFDTDDYSQPLTEDGGKSLYFNLNLNEYHLEYNAKTLTAEYPQEIKRDFTLKYIQNITFEKPEQITNLQNLIKCRITYQKSNKTMYYEIILVKLSTIMVANSSG